MKKASVWLTMALVFSLLLAACGGADNTNVNTTDQGNTAVPTSDVGTGEDTSGLAGDTTSTPAATMDAGETGGSDTTSGDVVATPIATSDASAQETLEVAPTAETGASGSTGGTTGDATGQMAQVDRFSDLMNYAVVDTQGQQIGNVRGLVIAVTGSADTTSSTNDTTTGSGSTGGNAGTTGSDQSQATATPESNTGTTGSDQSQATATPESNTGTGTTGSDTSTTGAAQSGVKGEILYVVVDRTGFAGSNAGGSTGSAGSGTTGTDQSQATATPESNTGTTGSDQSQATATPEANTGTGTTGSTGSDTGTRPENGEGLVLVPWTAFSGTGSGAGAEGGVSAGRSPQVGSSNQPLQTATPDPNASSDNAQTDTGTGGTGSTGSTGSDTGAATGSTGQSGKNKNLVLAVDTSVLDAAPTISRQQLAGAGPTFAMDDTFSGYWAQQGMQIPMTGTPAGEAETSASHPLVLQNDFRSIQVMGSDSSTIGQLQDFIINRNTGSVDFAVLNISGRMTPVPMSHFSVQQSGAGGVTLVLNQNSDRLNSAPTLDRFETFNFESGWDADFHSYWQDSGSSR